MDSSTQLIQEDIIQKDAAQKFALANDMIFVNTTGKNGAGFEIQGGMIRQVFWSDEDQAGYATVDLYGRKMRLDIDQELISDKARAYLKAGKVTVGVRSTKHKNYLVYTDTLLSQ